MVREELKKIGLSDEEINIYTYLLKKGYSKATKISKDLGVARTTIYRFLSKLITKGLVSENIQNNITFYFPVDPNRIPEILEERIEEIKSTIPELIALKTKTLEDTKVELFRGKEGIKTVMRDIIRESKNYEFIGEAEKYFSEMEIFTIQWIKLVEKNKINGRLLGSEEQKFKVGKTEEYKLLPKELIPEISICTYGEKTALFIWTDPYHAVLIKNKSVTKSYQKYFEYLWKIAKNPSKEHKKISEIKT